MKQKSQISLFVIIALVIVILAIGLTYISKTNTQTKFNNEFFQNIELKSEVDKVQSSILSCAEKTSRQALETIGLQGGYFNAPENSLKVDETYIPYYYYEGLIQRPSIDKIESELSNYIEANLNFCLDKINSPFQLIYENQGIKTKIRQDKVIFEIDSSIKIIKNKNYMILELIEYPVTIPSALNDIYETARYFTDAHENDPEKYCITCLNKLVKEKNLYIDIIPLENFQSFVIISENYTSSKPYSFEFLNKHTGNEKSVKTETSLSDNVPIAPLGEN